MSSEPNKVCVICGSSVDECMCCDRDDDDYYEEYLEDDD